MRMSTARSVGLAQDVLYSNHMTTPAATRHHVRYSISNSETRRLLTLAITLPSGLSDSRNETVFNRHWGAEKITFRWWHSTKMVPGLYYRSGDIWITDSVMHHCHIWEHFAFREFSAGSFLGIEQSTKNTRYAQERWDCGLLAVIFYDKPLSIDLDDWLQRVILQWSSTVFELALVVV